MYNSKVKYNTVVCYIFFGLLTSLLLGVRARTLAGAQYAGLLTPSAAGR